MLVSRLPVLRAALEQQRDVRRDQLAQLDVHQRSRSSSPWCWAYIRRRFVRSMPPIRLAPWADAWLDRIGALYCAHTAAAALPTDTPTAQR
jgi:hypothetical protein